GRHVACMSPATHTWTGHVMLRWPLLLILVPFAAPGADVFHPVEDIALAAEGAMRPAADTEAEAAVDPGLRLPRCSGALSATMQSATTVEVGCAEQGWRLFVPLRVQRFAEVYVLRRPVAAGERIDASMVSRERREVSRLPGGVVPANR